jgi:uncharacterized protein (DUF1501 family)
LHPAITLDQLADRQALLHAFDGMRQDVEETRGLDAMTAKALEIISSPRTCEAFDLSREPEPVKRKYGDPNNPLEMNVLLARRLVEAGVSVVTLTLQSRKSNGSVWDTHGKNFQRLKDLLPPLDRSVSALLTDIYERGLDQQVAVVLWGEMGRTPRINKDAGRDHWPQVGFVLLAGGGLKMGQVVGATDARGERATSLPYHPQNVLATLYQVLGIDPATTIPDHAGRPQYLLEDRRTIRELL